MESTLADACRYASPSLKLLPSAQQALSLYATTNLGEGRGGSHAAGASAFLIAELRNAGRTSAVPCLRKLSIPRNAFCATVPRCSSLPGTSTTNGCAPEDDGHLANRFLQHIKPPEMLPKALLPEKETFRFMDDGPAAPAAARRSSGHSQVTTSGAKKAARQAWMLLSWMASGSSGALGPAGSVGGLGSPSDDAGCSSSVPGGCTRQPWSQTDACKSMALSQAKMHAGIR